MTRWYSDSSPFTCFQSIDGTYKAMAVSVPSATELLDQIPGADPVVLYEVGSCITSPPVPQNSSMLLAPLPLKCCPTN